MKFNLYWKLKRIFNFKFLVLHSCGKYLEKSYISKIFSSSISTVKLES